MRWSELSQDQQVDLIAWYALADAITPSPREGLPVEFSRPLSELTVSAGKYRAGARKFVRRRRIAVHGQEIATGLVANRQPKVRREKHQLAS